MSKSTRLLALPLLASLIANTQSAHTAMAAANPQVNSVELPQQILRTGVDLKSAGLSPNTVQLAESIRVMPVLQRIYKLRAQLEDTQIADIADQNDYALTIKSLARRVELLESRQKAQAILMGCASEIDFVMAEIDAEQNVYAEILSTFQSDRDKAVARTNAISFITNGALWAVSGALNIPSYKYPGYSVQTGITGIIAGLVPSVASMYALKQYSGKKRTSDTSPNMLAKLFGYPAAGEVDYPPSVWAYLNSVPQDSSQNGKKALVRKDILIERWLQDKNIPTFTDINDKRTLDIITATQSYKKGLTIDSLNARLTMLEQLQGEVAKMKRLLLELTMVLNEEKAPTT